MRLLAEAMTAARKDKARLGFGKGFQQRVGKNSVKVGRLRTFVHRNITPAPRFAEMAKLHAGIGFI
jgi:hypothetical protein